MQPTIEYIVRRWWKLEAYHYDQVWPTRASAIEAFRKWKRKKGWRLAIVKRVTTVEESSIW